MLPVAQSVLLIETAGVTRGKTVMVMLGETSKAFMEGIRLADEIKSRASANSSQSRKFSGMPEQAVKRYRSGQSESRQVLSQAKGQADYWSAN